MKKFIFFIIALSVSFFSCSKDEISDVPAEITVPIGDINNFESPVMVGANGGSRYFVFNVNTDWYLSVDEPSSKWCHIGNYAEGKEGLHQIKIDADANDTNEEREAVITLTAKDVKKEVRVVQSQNDVVDINEESFEFDETGGEFDIKVNSNVKYNVSISADWIKESSAQARSLTESYHHFIVEESNEDRIGTIVFDYGTKKKTVTVKQECVLTFADDAISLAVSEEASLVVRNKSGENLIWESSDNDIVEVVNGDIIARGVGTAYITAMTSDQKHKAICKVDVFSVESMVKVSGGDGGYVIIASSAGSYAGYVNSFKLVNNLNSKITIKELKYYYFGIEVHSSKENTVVESGKSLNWQLRTNSKSYELIKCVVTFDYYGVSYTVSSY